MTANKTELNTTLNEIRRAKRRIQNLSTSKNWESTVKADILRTLTYADAYVRDYLESLEMEDKEGQEEAMKHLVVSKAIEYGEKNPT